MKISPVSSWGSKDGNILMVYLMRFHRENKIWNYYTGIFLKLDIHLAPLVVGSKYDKLGSTYTLEKLTGTKNMEFIM